MSKRLLWVGDAACPSGFGRVTHHVLETLRQTFEVTVMGINYRGDPHPYPYPIYAAAVMGDMFGVNRINQMCDMVRPDVIVIQQDGWNFSYYIQQLQRVPEFKDIPVVGIVAIDGKNFDGEWLKGLAHAIFWTEFGLNEAREGGYEGPATVIPLGVDLGVYWPMDPVEARKRTLPSILYDKFIIGNINRNQPRKRWDLTIRYFATWLKTFKIDDAYLYLHSAPTGDAGIDISRLGAYYGVGNRIAYVEPPTWYGVSEDRLRETYNAFDIQVSTTQGEGFGLTTLEGMACGVPQVVPDWSALGEICKDAAWVVPCTSTAIGPPYLNVIGGVVDETLFIAALQALYANKDYREHNSRAALARAEEPRFRWENIGARFAETLDTVLTPAHEEAPKQEVTA